MIVFPKRLKRTDSKLAPPGTESVQCLQIVLYACTKMLHIKKNFNDSNRPGTIKLVPAIQDKFLYLTSSPIQYETSAVRVSCCYFHFLFLVTDGH